MAKELGEKTVTVKDIRMTTGLDIQVRYNEETKSKTATVRHTYTILHLDEDGRRVFPDEPCRTCQSSYTEMTSFPGFEQAWQILSAYSDAIADRREADDAAAIAAINAEG